MRCGVLEADEAAGEGEGEEDEAACAALNECAADQVRRYAASWSRVHCRRRRSVRSSVVVAASAGEVASADGASRYDAEAPGAVGSGGSGEGGKAEGTLTVSPGRRKKERVKDEGSNDERASSDADEEETAGTGNGMGVRSASTMERPGCSQYGPVR